MAVANVSVKQRYQADGVLRSFAIPFAFIPGNGSSVTKVYKVTYDAQLVATETPMTEGALNDYVLDPAYNPATGIDNQNVIFNVAPAATAQVLVLRVLPLTQLLSFLNTGPTFYKTVEQGFDILTQVAQQLDEKIQRAPKFRVSGTSNDLPLPDPQIGGPYVWIINTDGEIEFVLPEDVSLQAAFAGQDEFNVTLNTISQILTGYAFNGTKYSSVTIEFEVQQSGQGVFTNGKFRLQYNAGAWQKVGQTEDDNGTPMGVTFGIQQTGTVVQLLANETGVGDAKVKLKRMFFLAS